MYFHIILTEKCNSQCKYCYGKSNCLEEFDNGLDQKFQFDFSAPTNSEINVEKLKSFLEKDPNPKIIFYGGEPLVNQDKLIEIIDALSDSDAFPEIEFYMQTNAKLLDKLPSEYLNKFKKILVSIDGDRERTDFNRGEGTYEKIIGNLKLARTRGFTGEIVARMTISPSINPESYDLIKQINYLFSLNLFDSIHWQLDLGFYKSDFNSDEKKKQIEKFLEKYNLEISKLIFNWVEEMSLSENVQKIYPFLGIFESLYYNKPTKLRCGSGYINYTITTAGDLTCCPIMNNIKDFYVGNITDSNPYDLKKIFVIKPCTDCKYLDICGGRCLYSNHSRLWPPEGQQLICNSVIHLIESLRKTLPKIKKLIKEDKISEEQFFYEKYFGPEIIP